MNEDQLMTAKIGQVTGRGFYIEIRHSIDDISRYSSDVDASNFYKEQAKTYQTLSSIHYKRARVAMGIE